MGSVALEITIGPIGVYRVRKMGCSGGSVTSPCSLSTLAILYVLLILANGRQY